MNDTSMRQLTPSQKEAVCHKEGPLLILAGPGSGKTRVLVHKLASLYLMEDVKHEQLLMVTFSRAAATEFKKRLLQLIGNAANFIEIKTFHAYCFDLLGKVGSIEKSQTIIKKAVEKIKNKDIEPNRITKTVLVIDEAQDMDEHEFELIKTLIINNEEMRVITVGDDDQNIFEFRGASSRYMEKFISIPKAKKIELIENFRSKANLVEFTNQFANKISNRLKKTPIVAYSNKTGLVKIIKYHGSNLVEPVIKNIQYSDLTGTTCILTLTNYEALQITGILLKKGLPAKLIQSNERFNLYNLLEVRYFIEQFHFTEDKFMISDSIWDAAKRKLKDKFQKSSKIDICSNLIKDFELSNPEKKYQSDFEVFIRESQLEDFTKTNGETIFVSTIHKAKGKEFDNVFLMLDGFNPDTDEKKRLLYVAMTRAKQNIAIHLNGNYLDGISCLNIERKYDDYSYMPSNLLVLHLSHKDIWLDYFISKQNVISNFKSGMKLEVNKDGCSDKNGNCIVKFSKKFIEKISDYESKGYMLTESEINYIVYWKKEEMKNEIMIVLPQLIFHKNNVKKFQEANKNAV